jgi:hypothetical protein
MRKPKTGGASAPSGIGKFVMELLEAALETLR